MTSHSTIASLLHPSTPASPPTLASPWGGVWRIEPDLFIVEAAPNNAAPPYCATVLVDVHGIVYCTCPDGRRRIGCAHVLAVGELLDQPPRSA